ncbi:MAG: MFS transporter [Acidimicrobiales bacterium]|nr:MFS transporter [Acidimicrobiales bacterium]MYG60604.1 MFS transporter [Acidimicrobiales bacterium]
MCRSLPQIDAISERMSTSKSMAATLSAASGRRDDAPSGGAALSAGTAISSHSMRPMSTIRPAFIISMGLLSPSTPPGDWTVSPIQRVLAHVRLAVRADDAHARCHAHRGKLAGRLFSVNVPVATGGRSQRLVRGWVVLTGVFGVMMITSGMVFYALGAFLDAFVDEQEFSTGLAGAGVTAFLVASGVCGYYTGAFVNRIDVRWVITCGVLISSVGMALLAQIRSGWQMFAVMAVFGVGFGMCGLVPTTTVVTRWFQRRRSVALSIASTGLSLGGILLLPQMTRRIEADTLVAWAPRFAAVYCVALLLSTWLFIRAWPHEVGLAPDGDPVSHDSRTGEAAAQLPGTPFESAVRSRFFIFTGIGFVLVMGSQIGAIQHIYKLTGDRLSLEAAATGAVSVLAGTSVVARICGGIAALKASLRWLTISLMVVQCIGLCVLAVADTDVTILVGVIVLGSAMGNLLMLHPLILADAFGVKDYPRIYGFGSLLMVIGGAGGPVLVGVLRDSFSYQSAFFAIAAIAAAGLVIYSFAGNPLRDHLAAPSPAPLPTSVAKPLTQLTAPAPAIARNGDADAPPEVLFEVVANGTPDDEPTARPRRAPEVWSVERT